MTEWIKAGLLAGVPLLVVTACVPTRDVSVSPVQASRSNLEIAQAHMAESLKDPESIKIRRVSHYRTAEGDWIVCGEMDAKNGFGGYNGYRAFYVRLQGTRVKIAYFGEDGRYAATNGCGQAASGTIEVRA